MEIIDYLDSQSQSILSAHSLRDILLWTNFRNLIPNLIQTHDKLFQIHCLMEQSNYNAIGDLMIDSNSFDVCFDTRSRDLGLNSMEVYVAV
jgi:hypothetical protein